MESFRVKAIAYDDRPLVAAALEEAWGSTIVVSRGRVWEPATLPGYLAFCRDELAGVATYRVEGDACELVSINAFVSGAGRVLLSATKDAARRAGCRRLWLITTNDNTPALRFYQRRGMRLAALHRDALEEARRLKPTIPFVGLDGIPIRDEIELECALT